MHILPGSAASNFTACAQTNFANWFNFPGVQRRGDWATEVHLVNVMDITYQIKSLSIHLLESLHGVMMPNQAISRGHF